MSLNDERLTRQKAATQDRIATLRAQQRRIEAKQAARARQRRSHRLTYVGTLAEAAGLLWCDDGVLEKLFALVAAETVAHDRASDDDAAAASGFASPSPLGQVRQTGRMGTAEIARFGDDEKN